MSSLVPVIQVVRRFGPVGGMERYVWELSLALKAMGHPVTVICERCHASKPDGIDVHELGAVMARPRWLALLRFGGKVARFLATHPLPGAIIHSHERLGIHDITTFHGPPFATVFEKPWWRLLSLRVAMQLLLERRELSRPRLVVPNSQVIAQLLAHYYPQVARKLTQAVVPGVVPGAVRQARTVALQAGVVGFVGKEWQRKGLPWAVAVVAALRCQRPDVQLHVVGPLQAQAAPLFSAWQGGYQLLGWRDQAPYPSFDVLLHPARAEPYGMVISEAMAAGVPVVISDVCGAAAQVTPAAGTVLPLTAGIQAWAQAVNRQLNRDTPVPRFARPWSSVAQEYSRMYASIASLRVQDVIDPAVKN